MLKIAFSPVYRYELPEGHRFPMVKYDLLPEQLVYEGTISEGHFFHPQRLDDAAITTTHAAEYLEKLKMLSLSKKEIRKIGFPLSHKLVERGRFISMGTLECAYFAKEFGVAMNIAGGTHHAFKDRGEGFCLLNDIAIASNILLGRGEARRILVIDLDVHQGNGTAEIFKDDDRVFTFSMHGAKNYPVRKSQSDLDIGLPDGTDDAPYLTILGETLPRLMDLVQPDMIFYLSGVDVLKSDKLGRLALSLEACKRRDHMVFSICKKQGIPVAVSMGGGYSSRLTDIIEAHANTFRTAQELYF